VTAAELASRQAASAHQARRTEPSVAAHPAPPVARTPPFDLENPPVEPPPGCLDRQRWRLAVKMFVQHQSEADGRCQCGEAWQCAGRGRAIRGLLTACLQVGTVKVNMPAGMASPHICRWCERGVALHPVYGWVHVGSGLLVCDRQPQDGNALSVAEPVSTSR
jgi:hypothetical protein